MKKMNYLIMIYLVIQKEMKIYLEKIYFQAKKNIIKFWNDFFFKNLTFLSELFSFYFDFLLNEIK